MSILTIELGNTTSFCLGSKGVLHCMPKCSYVWWHCSHSPNQSTSWSDLLKKMEKKWHFHPRFLRGIGSLPLIVVYSLDQQVDKILMHSDLHVVENQCSTQETKHFEKDHGRMTKQMFTSIVVKLEILIYLCAYIYIYGSTRSLLTW